MSAQGIQRATPNAAEQKASAAELARLVRRLHMGNNVAMSILWGVALIVVLVFVGIIAFLVIQGLQYLVDPAFYAPTDLGVGNQIYNTFYILILAEVILFPIALSAAIYTVEYAPQGLLVTIIRFAAETLAGVP